jgi:uncharacterized protein with von Willebrand factor type A (vWA) domain
VKKGRKIPEPRGETGDVFKKPHEPDASVMHLTETGGSETVARPQPAPCLDWLRPADNSPRRMSWTDRLLGVAAGGAGTLPEQAARLPASFARAVDRLTRCASLAPSAASEAELRELTKKAEALQGRLREALAQLAVPTPDAGSDSEVLQGRNHWARLVSTLEQHREVRSQLLEAAIALAETNPELSKELQRLGREEGAVTEELRDMIARADPQAAN